MEAHTTGGLWGLIEGGEGSRNAALGGLWGMHPLFSGWAGLRLEMQTHLVGCKEAKHGPHMVLPHHPALSFLQHPQEVLEVRSPPPPKCTEKTPNSSRASTLRIAHERTRKAK